MDQYSNMGYVGRVGYAVANLLKALGNKPLEVKRVQHSLDHANVSLKERTSLIGSLERRIEELVNAVEMHKKINDEALVGIDFAKIGSVAEELRTAFERRKYVQLSVAMWGQKSYSDYEFVSAVNTRKIEILYKAGTTGNYATKGIAVCAELITVRHDGERDGENTYLTYKVKTEDSDFLLPVLETASEHNWSVKRISDKEAMVTIPLANLKNDKKKDNKTG